MSERRLAKRIREANGRKLLSIFFTAGYPNLKDTLPLAEACEQAGADFLEIGMPYSDPLADGPVIQATSEQALRNGMSIQKLFEQLATLRENVSIPIYLMGYLNPVIQYGTERFFDSCAKVGVDGILLPDLPLDEFEQEYLELCESRGLKSISLVTPQTSDERIRRIDAVPTDFVYVVSTPSTTGNALSVGEQESSYYKRLLDLELQSPLMIGFGIRDRDSFHRATESFSGGIIGTAFLRAIADADSVFDAAKSFVTSIR